MIIPKRFVMLFALGLGIGAAAPSLAAQPSTLVTFSGGLGTTAQDWVTDVALLKREGGEVYRYVQDGQAAQTALGYGYLVNDQNDPLTLLLQKRAEARNRGFVNATVDKQAAQVRAALDAGARVLLLGHSQGALYANAVHDRLQTLQASTAHLRVTHVGSAANRVAGNGSYLTSSKDGIIDLLRVLYPALAANVRQPAGHGMATYALPPQGAPAGTPGSLKTLLHANLAQLSQSR